MTEGKFKAGGNGTIAIGPAAVIAKWGATSSGKVRLIFSYWDGLEKKLPKELRPMHGDQQPHLVADSADHAKEITAGIKAWLLAKHPALKQKKQQELTSFIVSDKKSYRIEAYPEEELDFVLEGIKDSEDVAITWQIAGDAKSPAIMWQCNILDDVRVTITDDEVRFEADDEYAEYHPKAKKHGTLAFVDGVLGAVSLDTTFASLREPVAPVTLEAPKKPTLLKGKKSDYGDGFVAKIEKGTYAVLTGADAAAKLRWLELTRS